MRTPCILLICAACAALLTAPAAAGVGGELFLASGTAFDAGSLLKSGVGMEIAQNFAGESGEWGNASLQARYMMYRNLTPDHRVSESETLWKTEVHDAYFNLKGLYGRLNLRVGRFKTPLGLHPVVDDHTELLSSSAMENLEAARRWGVSLNGQLDRFDYECAALAGGKLNPLDRRRGEWTAAARVQPVFESAALLGFSALWSDSGNGAEGETEFRAAADLQTVLFLLEGTVEPRLEFSAGRRGERFVYAAEAAAARPFGDGDWRWTLAFRANQDRARTLLSLRKQEVSFAWEALFSQDLSQKAASNGRRTALLILFYRTI